MVKEIRPEDIRTFGMRNLMLESELQKLEASGIEIAHCQTIQNAEVVDTDLFQADILREARRMASFYVLYFAIENTIRRLISSTLGEKYGQDWWTAKAPEGLRKNVKDLQDKERDSLLAIRSDDPLTYTNFGELIDIFNANWADFSDVLRSRKAVQETLSKLNQLRSVVAHSCSLSEDDITRFELHIKDWLRIQS